MCDSPIMCYLAKNPKPMFGNFFILTRQYREIVQLNKEYLFFPSESNKKYLSRFQDVQSVWLPCGKCIQCVNKRSKSWEIRSIFEMLRYGKNCCCLTLTYDDEHLTTLPKSVTFNNEEVNIDDNKNGIINYKDVQDFVKRLRKHFKFRREIKYICSSEYGGSGTLRPHYHILLFNYSPVDIDTSKVRKSKKGTLLYKSPFLTKLWGKGFVDVGKADLQSARYISQYCCKNFLKERKCASSYDKLLLKVKNSISKESLHASIGLGLYYFKSCMHNIIQSGCIKYGKFTYSIPRYFINKLESINLKLFTKVKEKGHSFWLNFVFDDEAKRKAIKRTEDLLSKLNLFHGDVVGVLCT